MTTNRPNGSVYTQIENKIATLEFGHPANNTLTTELLARLTNEFNTLSENPNITIIILKSEGEGPFCTGDYFDPILTVSNPEEGTAFFSGLAHLMNAMRTCSKIIIGRIHGKAVSNGVGLIAACDYALASVDGAIKLSELSIGICPFVIAPIMERKIGVGALSELTLATYEWKNAYWAREKGLYAKVFDRVSELDKEVEIFTSKLSKYNPDALIALKKVLWEDTKDWDKLLTERAALSGAFVLSNFTSNKLNKL